MATPKGITLDQVEWAILELTAASGGIPPTLRELQGQLGLRSTAAIQSHLDSLRDAGRVTWQPGRARTLQVVGVDQGSGALKAPDPALVHLLEVAERVVKRQKVSSLTERLSLEHACRAARAKLFPEGQG
ncbi:hypothetical protein [Vacuolonema iberomarrocanum]|uniref:LexA family protein n=1 Tax=Vacuolonema iberomarrocanum TaxID=3454632 RepID=UPI0019E5BCF8|nr:hypothetical protein [filamentous cyanobacterium LEGE 07170]